jgi:DNA invertase Pin-like site-specific DNA recombinase
MRVGYTRVSTDQLHQVTSIDWQIITFKAMKCDLILEERDSDTNVERPEYQRLIKMIKMGQVKQVNPG